MYTNREGGNYYTYSGLQVSVFIAHAVYNMQI